MIRRACRPGGHINALLRQCMEHNLTFDSIKACTDNMWCRLPAPVGVCYGVPLYPCAFPVFFLDIIPAPYIGVLYAGLIRSLYTCPIFSRLAIYDPFCTHSKSRPLDSECGFPKVGLNFRCSIFSFCGTFPGKISGLIFP